MSAAPAEQEMVLGPESAGLLMTPEEFDAIEVYNEEYRYELVNGVLVVRPIPSVDEIGPSELLGHLLFQYQQRPTGEAILDASLPQQYVYTPTSRRLADRVIWTGLGGFPDVQIDVPTIAVEFVSGDFRDRRRDYIDKRREYAEAGISEYWIFDRFQRTLTVIQYGRRKQKVQVVSESSVYESSILPGFELPVRRILEAADRWAKRR